jgi:hypothetical protein
VANLHLSGKATGVWANVMKFAKPILLIPTPLGVVFGLIEGYRLAGGLVVLMAALLGMLSVAAGTVVCAVRREQHAERPRGIADASRCASRSRAAIEWEAPRSCPRRSSLLPGALRRLRSSSKFA